MPAASRWPTSALGGVDENDPRSVATFMKKMGHEIGEDVGDLEQAMEEEMDEGAEATMRGDPRWQPDPG